MIQSRRFRCASVSATWTTFPILALLVVLMSIGCSKPDGSVASTAAARSPTAPPDAAAADAEAGRDAWVLPDEMGGIYVAQCAVCHGQDFEGSRLGPALVGAPLVHGDRTDEIVTSIEQGFPTKGMPAWKGVLADSDVRGLAIYLLEKRQGDPGLAGQGVGEPPVIPTEPIATRHHRLAIEPVHTGLEEPYGLAVLPDGRVLVTEKMKGLSIVAADGSGVTRVTGTPRFYDDSVLRGTAYTGSGWAQDVELHPAHATNGWIYLSYGDRCEACNEASRADGEPVTMIKLVRGRLDGARWVDQQTIWQAPRETYQAGVENGASARIAFDDTGHVYLTIGSFSEGYEGVQQMDRPDGKIIRVRDDGETPEDNPFVGVDGALPSIWTVGHRNAQGLAFDRARRLLWSSEHGPRGGDEGNLILPGHNYGWPMVSLGVDYDGRPIRYAAKYGIDFDPADLTAPMIDWTPSPGVSSIVFYRGDAFPAWQDDMIVATLSKNDLWRYRVDATGVVEHETLVSGLGRFRDVEVGPAGELVVLIEHRAGSQVLRIVPAND